MRSGEREKRRQEEELAKRRAREEQEKVEEEHATVALMVQGRRLECSSKVVELSGVFKCMVAATEDEEAPFPVPDFISRQIMLDLVEIVERGDTGQCAHLVLVSLSYLLDFLIAVDFLGFTEVKSTVEARIQEHITDSTWKEIFHYTKDIIGLFNTTRHTIEYICRRLQEGEGKDRKEAKEEEWVGERRGSWPGPRHQGARAARRC